MATKTRRSFTAAADFCFEQAKLLFTTSITGDLEAFDCVYIVLSKNHNFSFFLGGGVKLINSDFILFSLIILSYVYFRSILVPPCVLILKYCSKYGENIWRVKSDLISILRLYKKMKLIIGAIICFVV